ncbi:dienelactone hydrolase [Clavibacter michiganensis]|uniref:alpha/beta hydrolase n=1 Tax=Clavibacter michiganensis TaxID=28447 RepID=UPI001DB2380C|nr:alpha/beta hydrolase [Clavibacter michiganensis]MBM7412642.1 dienelactone hydrolase [Clavibacter michiganensis]
MSTLIPLRRARHAAAVAAIAVVLAVAAPISAPARAADAAPVDEIAVPRSDVSGFGGGVVFAPEAPAGTTLGAVVITPGFRDTHADMRWYGEALAAAGYVAFTIDTDGVLDRPGQREQETLAAVDYLTGSSAVSAEVDPARVAVLGYSMGGAGVLRAAQARHELKAVVAVEPFDVPASYPSDTTPTLIITGQADPVAIPFLMGKRMYRSIPAPTPKEYVELRGAGHTAGVRTPNATIRDAATTFLARYLDGDESVSICPAPAATGPISASMSYCG